MIPRLESCRRGLLGVNPGRFSWLKGLLIGLVCCILYCIFLIFWDTWIEESCTDSVSSSLPADHACTFTSCNDILPHSPNSLQRQVNIRSPSPKTLNGNTAPEVLCVRSAQRQPVPQPCNAAQVPTTRREGIQSIDISILGALHVEIGEGRETVRPDIREHFGRDATASIADSDRDALRRRAGTSDGFVRVGRANYRVDVEANVGIIIVLRRARRVRSGFIGEVTEVVPRDVWRRGDGHFDGLAVGAVFDDCPERIFQQLGDDVFHVYGDIGKRRIGLSTDNHLRARAVLQLAYLPDEILAVLDDARRRHGTINNPDVIRRNRILGHPPRTILTACPAFMVTRRLRGKIQRQVLFRYQPRAYPRAQMRIQEPRHLNRINIPSALQEPAREDRDGIRVGLHQIRQHICELPLFFQGCDLPLLVGEQGGQGMEVVAVDLGDVRVGDDNEGEVPQGLDSRRESSREEGQREVGGAEEGLV